MSGWRLYILGWKVREVCFIFVCQFVSLSVHRFIFIRQFVSLSVRQFYFHSSVRRFVSLSVRQFVSFIFIRQFVRLSVRQVDLLSACRLVGSCCLSLAGLCFLLCKIYFSWRQSYVFFLSCQRMRKNSAGSLISIYCMDYLPEWFVFSPYSACLPLFWWPILMGWFPTKIHWRTDKLTNWQLKMEPTLPFALPSI